MYKVISKFLNISSKMLFKVEVVGLENIPSEGACILAANHKSNWDAIFICGLMGDRVINAVAKEELFKIPVLKTILKKCFVIPVNRNKPDMVTIKSILKVLKDEKVLGIFPEGTRHKDLDTFASPKAGLGMFAVKGKSVVVPISIVTNYELFSKVVIYIDKPISFDAYYDKRNKSDDYEYISNVVMNTIKSNYFAIKNTKVYD